MSTLPKPPAGAVALTAFRELPHGSGRRKLRLRVAEPPGLQSDLS